jgi:ribonuclease BN (tRNA processing enzyme)
MKVILLGTGGPKPDPNRQDPSLAVQVDRTILLFASANLGGGCSAGVYHQIVKNMQKKNLSQFISRRHQSDLHPSSIPSRYR